MSSESGTDHGELSDSPEPTVHSQVIRSQGHSKDSPITLSGLDDEGEFINEEQSNFLPQGSQSTSTAISNSALKSHRERERERREKKERRRAEKRARRENRERAREAKRRRSTSPIAAGGGGTMALRGGEASGDRGDGVRHANVRSLSGQGQQSRDRASHDLRDQLREKEKERRRVVEMLEAEENRSRQKISRERSSGGSGGAVSSVGLIPRSVARLRGDNHTFSEQNNSTSSNANRRRSPRDIRDTRHTISAVSHVDRRDNRSNERRYGSQAQQSQQRRDDQYNTASGQWNSTSSYSVNDAVAGSRRRYDSQLHQRYHSHEATTTTSFSRTKSSERSYNSNLATSSQTQLRSHHSPSNSRSGSGAASTTVLDVEKPWHQRRRDASYDEESESDLDQAQHSDAADLDHSLDTNNHRQSNSEESEHSDDGEQSAENHRMDESHEEDENTALHPLRSKFDSGSSDSSSDSENDADAGSDRGDRDSREDSVPNERHGSRAHSPTNSAPPDKLDIVQEKGGSNEVTLLRRGARDASFSPDEFMRAGRSEAARATHDSPASRGGERGVEVATAATAGNNGGKPVYLPALMGCRSVEEFNCLNRIEEGTYGVVYRARDKKTNEIVALKRLKMEKEKEGFPITSLREINTLLKASHMNIVHVREIVVGSNMDKIYIVMDYVEHDLKSLMETMKQPFLIGEVKCLLLQLLRGVAHLHDNWILHRDLKTSNLLLNHRGILKIGDFGLAREYGSPLKRYTNIVVTLWYRAPELLLGTRYYSTPIDLWSVGCIFGELLLMKALFPGKGEMEQLELIFRDLGTPTESCWKGVSELPVFRKAEWKQHKYNMLRQRFNTMLTDDAFDLIMQLLKYDPEQRATALKAQDHVYFKNKPLPVDPSMFPTWPAKSEGSAVPSKVKDCSPKPPSGGKSYANLLADPDRLMEGSDSRGFHMSGATRGVSSFGHGFHLKF